VEWADGETTGREVTTDDIALDIVPDPGYITPGTTVLFRQGSYIGRRRRFERWHQGTISGVKIENGNVVYVGHHNKGSEDGKPLDYAEYSYEFEAYADNIRLLTTVKPTPPPTQMPIMDSSARVPVIALCNDRSMEYLAGTAVNFDDVTKEFELDWLDKTEPFDSRVSCSELAIDQEPNLNDVIVNNPILFKQGSYTTNRGRVSHDLWHRGKVTSIDRDNNGNIVFSGQHIFGESDGKWTGYQNYDPSFNNITTADLRNFLQCKS